MAYLSSTLGVGMSKTFSVPYTPHTIHDARRPSQLFFVHLLARKLLRHCR